MRDGRAFLGLAFLLRCWCADADCVVLEQPNTIAPDFLPLPRPARLRPSHFGDPCRKPINLFLRGTHELHLPCPHALSSTAGLGVLADLPDSDSRDRHRSSWARYPRLRAALAWQLAPCDPVAATPDFGALIQSFALQWHLAGLHVPHDYASPTGQPTCAEIRAYQLQRGPGDERAVRTVTPWALAHANDAANAAGICPGALGAAVPLASFISLISSGVLLCVVAIRTQPLVLAHADGFIVIGANLSAPHPRACALRVAQHWLHALLSTSSALATFLVGEYAGGPRLAVAPVPFVVDHDAVARIPASRRRALAAGASFLWCTLAVLSGTVAHPSFARAVLAAEALVRPVPNIPTSRRTTAPPSPLAPCGQPR
eukprot:1022945-Pleurochrysis_carterae.AAC.2